VTDLPEQRAFALGFAYQPYDWNEEAFAETARILADHGDIVGIFYDGFIPWQEAANTQPYHANVESVLTRRAAAIADHHQVLVSTSILGGDRVSLSGYLGESDLPREGEWASRTFDDPAVIAAYLHWCRDLIQRFDPDYFVYVMEIDAGLTDPNDPRFQALLRAVQQIYPALKQEYSELPLIIEFVLMNDEEMTKRAGVIEALLPYTDIYGVSTYPFLHAGGDPAQIEHNWFSRVQTIAPNKPFAVVETNHLAEDFEHPQGVLDPATGKRVLIPGTEEWQAQYLDFLFRETQALDAAFVIQWTSRDLDRLAELWRGTGAAFDPDIEPMGNVANDCGIYDENGRARPSLTVWQAWLDLPRLPRASEPQGGIVGRAPVP